MISDILSDAVAEIEKHQHTCPDFYAHLAVEIGVAKTVMDTLRIVLEPTNCDSDVFDDLREDLRQTLFDADVSKLVIARKRLLAWVKQELIRQPQQPKVDPADATDAEWQPLGSIAIDSGRLLLVDSAHRERVAPGASDGQIAIQDDDLSAVLVSTGIGDGWYRAEVKYIDVPIFGKCIAEVRVLFLDGEGNWLGGDPQ